MEEAFGVYLKECCGIDMGFSPYDDFSPINKCVESVIGEGITLFDIRAIEDHDDLIGLDNVINKLKDSKLYEDLAKIPPKRDDDEVTETLVEETIDYTKVLNNYRNFLVAYKFFEKWSEPSQILIPEETISKNMIVYGAPGTGKSHFLENIPGRTDDNTTRVTFHPDSDYASFVGCYKPIKDGNDLTYEFVPQAFTNAYVNAWMDEKPYYLIIEEINRGNCAQIFGDLFQLLDRKDNESEYPIKTDKDLENYLKKALLGSRRTDIPKKVKDGEILKLPKNLWILATMNTSDQSLYPMDSAFKRRWEWKYIPFEKGKQDNYIVVDDSAYSWSAFLDAINTKIKAVTQSEDKQLGYWFVKADNRQISASTFVNKVLFYLWNDIFKDYSDASLFEGLTFQSFFKVGNKLDYTYIKDLLEHRLKLEKRPQIEVIKSINSDTSVARSNGEKFTITYNGKEYDNPIAKNLFVEIIKAIGPERIQTLGRKVYNGPFIVADKQELNGRDSVEIKDNMFLLVGLSNKDKKKILCKIKELLSLDLTINEATD